MLVSVLPNKNKRLTLQGIRCAEILKCRVHVGVTLWKERLLDACL